MRVFISGSASHLAQVLLPKLCAQVEISAVVGVDLKTTDFKHPKFVQHIADIRDPDIAQHLQACDALVHLAFVVLRGKMAATTMHDINVQGTCALFNAARQAGVQRFVHLSSAAVYGNGENLDESAALRPLPGLLYARHKAQVETWLERGINAGLLQTLGMAFAGSPAECIAYQAKYREQGVTHLLLAVGAGAVTQEVAHESMHCIAEEVMPALQAGN